MAASSAAGAFCSGSAGIAVHDCTVTVAICGHFGRKIAFQDARLLGSRRISERVGHLGFRFGVHVSPGTSLTTGLSGNAGGDGRSDHRPDAQEHSFSLASAAQKEGTLPSRALINTPANVRPYAAGVSVLRLSRRCSSTAAVPFMRLSVQPSLLGPRG